MSKPAKIDQIRQTSIQTLSPRSKPGRQRSSQNAIKHGIFSEFTILPGEPRHKYESLLQGFSERLQPADRLEEFLVEKLASIAWRHRRLLLAEGAEIRESSEFLEWDQRNQQRQEAEELGTRKFPLELISNEGSSLIYNIRNSDILERCLELLCELRQEIRSSGLEKERDTSILRKIYGSDEHLRENLRESYLLWVASAEAPEEERQREGYATPEQCKENVLSEIQAEIRRLQNHRREQAAIESERTNLETMRRKVPESVKLDRLLRYEASLERAFDRTLNQLERMQRLRRGQPVAPRIDVNLST